MVLKIEYPLSTEEQPEDDVTIEMPTVSVYMYKINFKYLK